LGKNALYFLTPGRRETAHIVVREIIDNHISHDVVVLHHEYAWDMAVGVIHAVITGKVRFSEFSDQTLTPDAAEYCAKALPQACRSISPKSAPRSGYYV